MRFIAMSTNEGIQPRQLSRRNRLAIVLLVVTLIIVGSCVATISLLTTGPGNTPTGPESTQTTLSASGNAVHFDHSATTNIIVDITGDSIPDGTEFTVTTLSTGTEIPEDADGHPLNVNGAVTYYYDVKVTSAATLTPDIMAQITITNNAFDSTSVMYYYDASQAEWIALTTQFEAPHTVIASLPASTLAGTPIGVPGGGDEPTPTPSTTPTNAPTNAPTATPTSNPTYAPSATATPAPERHITIEAAVGGTTNPLPGTYITSGYPVITVTANPGYTFTRWDIYLHDQYGDHYWSENPWNPCTVIYDYAVMTPVFTSNSEPTPVEPTPTGIWVVPEYTWGPLLVLMACFAAFAVLKFASKINFNRNSVKL
ncbi:MAG: hypothetical protein NWE92_07945 [Candidatus Bathyarchaeota archaeon]|nr:hypothetical protein [Candidatus Bathyarchaeota archaeon]